MDNTFLICSYDLACKWYTHWSIVNNSHLAMTSIQELQSLLVDCLLDKLPHLLEHATVAVFDLFSNCPKIRYKMNDRQKLAFPTIISPVLFRFFKKV